MQPADGEPENYLIGQVHSPGAAAEMEDIWEFIAPEALFTIEKSERLGGRKRRYFITPPQGEHRGLFRPKGHLLFVDENSLQWFKREADGWVDFNEVVVV